MHEENYGQKWTQKSVLQASLKLTIFVHNLSNPDRGVNTIGAIGAEHTELLLIMWVLMILSVCHFKKRVLNIIALLVIVFFCIVFSKKIN